ncbi:hypothetical protein EBV26_15115 [bacterium]|nr:hypothetical protein [bacterium]
MSSNDTLIATMMAEMDDLQKRHMAFEEHEAYEEAEWAEDLVAQKKAKVGELQQFLEWAQMDLDSANKTYDRIKNVPRAQRRGVNFKTETTLHDRLSIREKWDTLNKLLKTVGKEERKLEYLDRPWRWENTDVPQVPQPKQEKVEATQVPEPKPEKTYTPPPRVLDAEYHWPFSRCKNLARLVLKEKLSRNHFGLIQQLSAHYNMAPEQFKKTSPADLLNNNRGVLRQILDYLQYRQVTGDWF